MLSVGEQPRKGLRSRGRGVAFDPADDGHTRGVVCGDEEARPLYVSHETARVLRLFPKHGDPPERNAPEQNVQVLQVRFHVDPNVCREPCKLLGRSRGKDDLAKIHGGRLTRGRDTR